MSLKAKLFSNITQDMTEFSVAIVLTQKCPVCVSAILNGLM